MNKLSKIAGLLAPISAFLTLVISVATHSWFSLTENAFSDLGAVGVEDAWIFNTGIFISGVLALLYTLGLYSDQKTALSKFGALLFIIASISLIMIAIFPEGTPLHMPVSVAFFVLASIGILLIGLADERRWFRYFSIGLFIGGWALGLLFMLTFEGMALPELVGICAFSIWTYAYLLGR